MDRKGLISFKDYNKLFARYDVEIISPVLCLELRPHKLFLSRVIMSVVSSLFRSCLGSRADEALWM